MRIIVGLRSGAEPEAVAAALREQGARDVRAAMPDVVIADFPEGDAARTLQDVAALPDVRYAEPDAMQSAF